MGIAVAVMRSRYSIGDFTAATRVDLDVVVEGEATRDTDDGVLIQLAKAWPAKWDGRWQYEARDGAFHHPGGGEVLVFRVTPRKVLAFGKGAFTHTSYRFASPEEKTQYPGPANTPSSAKGY
jgi:hypothetical protein